MSWLSNCYELSGGLQIRQQFCSLRQIPAMEQMQIRQATIADAEFISLLARITFSETFSHLFPDKHELFNYYYRTFSVPKIRSSLQNENNLFLLAIHEELPIGYAKLKKNAPTSHIDSTNVSQLQHIYLLQDYVSKRIGQHLIQRVFDEIAKLHKDYCWVSVYDQNLRAMRFYKGRDFRLTGSHKFSIGKQSYDFTVLKKEME